MSDEPPKDRLTRVLELLLPARMAADLDEELGEDTDSIAEMLTRYLTACPIGRADMAAFHESDGIAKVDCAIYKAQQGMLSEWAGLEEEESADG